MAGLWYPVKHSVRITTFQRLGPATGSGEQLDMAQPLYSRHRRIQVGNLPRR